MTARPRSGHTHSKGANRKAVTMPPKCMDQRTQADDENRPPPSSHAPPPGQPPNALRPCPARHRLATPAARPARWSAGHAAARSRSTSPPSGCFHRRRHVPQHSQPRSAKGPVAPASLQGALSGMELGMRKPATHRKRGEWRMSVCGWVSTPSATTFRPNAWGQAHHRFHNGLRIGAAV